MDHEEKALIKEAQRGNIMAFQSLVEKYDRQVLQLAFSFVQNIQDAQDIYQEIFVRVYKNIGRFKFKSQFSTWLYRIVVNYCINFKRKRGKAKYYSLNLATDESSEEWQTSLQGDELNPEDSLLNVELSHEINRALESLSLQQKTVFILRHYHGHKLKDIANIMKCSEGTIKNYLFRATQKMQKLLQTYVQS